jgi:hypothetical protein
MVRIFIIAIYIYVLALPLAVPRHITSLRYLSTVCLIAIIYVTLVVVI